MKKASAFFSCILFCGLILCSIFLGGCSGYSPNPDNTVRFFYCQTSPSYSDRHQVIVAEEREVSGRKDGLFYLLSLYLLGPTGDSLSSPFPKGTMVLSVHTEGSSVTVQLSEEAAGMQDSRYTLACACLSMTCMQQPGIRSVTVQSGSRSLTLTAQDLTLYDNSTSNSTESED